MSDFLNKLFQRGRQVVALGTPVASAATSPSGTVQVSFSINDPYLVNLESLPAGETLFSLVYRLSKQAGVIPEDNTSSPSELIDIFGSTTRLLVNGGQVISDMSLTEGMVVKVVRIQGKNG
jgi:hypothetical protein